MPKKSSAFGKMVDAYFEAQQELLRLELEPKTVEREEFAQLTEQKQAAAKDILQEMETQDGNRKG